MTPLELELWKRVASLAQSPSHDFHHIDRVRSYALALTSKYGGDPIVVAAAVILHDLGRSDETRMHGLESIQASREMAIEILQNVNLDEDRKKRIIEAIETHDQPGLKPPSIEGRILKDADFLAGFGAWGVLRVAMWSGETGRRLDDVLKRLASGMQRRFEGLEFEMSRETARRSMLFARLFTAELAASPAVQERALPGWYVVLEGMSGSGKNTVAAAVSSALLGDGIPVTVVDEPGKTFKELRTAAHPSEDDPHLKRDPHLMKALLMADRVRLVNDRIQPALERNEFVLSVRSYLSTVVYQCSDPIDRYMTLLGYDWMPKCDLLILLDVPEGEASSRIAQRGKSPGAFEEPEQLEQAREDYLAYWRSFPARQHELVDAARSKDKVASAVIALVRELVK